MRNGLTTEKSNNAETKQFVLFVLGSATTLAIGMALVGWIANLFW